MMTSVTISEGSRLLPVLQTLRATHTTTRLKPGLSSQGPSGRIFARVGRHRVFTGARLWLKRIVGDTMEAPSLETPVRVMFFDTDAGGVVHNIAYLRFIETNRSLLAEKLGWEMGERMLQGDCPVVIRTEIDYRRPARLWDDLVVRGWLDKFERTRFWCAFTITRPRDGQVLITCRQMLVVVKLPEMKVQRLPAFWNTAWEQLKG